MGSSVEVLKVWFKRVWGELDISAIDEMLDPDCAVQGLGNQPLLGPNDFKVFHQAICELIEDIQVNVDKSIDEGSWSSALCHLRAVTKAGGRPVRISGSVMLRVEDGIIREAYNHWDFITFFEQLELLPKGCMELGLRGSKIA